MRVVTKKKQLRKLPGLSQPRRGIALGFGEHAEGEKRAASPSIGTRRISTRSGIPSLVRSREGEESQRWRRDLSCARLSNSASLNVERSGARAFPQERTRLPAWTGSSPHDPITWPDGGLSLNLSQEQQSSTPQCTGDRPTIKAPLGIHSGGFCWTLARWLLGSLHGWDAAGRTGDAEGPSMGPSCTPGR